MKNSDLILAPGQFPSIAVPERQSHSDSTRYEWLTVPVMDAREEAYRVELSVRAADIDAEQALAEYLSHAVNGYPLLVGALLAAYQALDSVAFLSVEGDTEQLKRQLLDTMQKVGATNRVLERCAIKK